MTPEEKFEKFVAALEALCLEYGVELYTSLYDHIAVWPMSDPKNVIGCGIDNKLG